jgi:hypothetical protein
MPVLGPPCPAAAAVVAHPGNDLTERQVAPRRVHLGQYAALPASVAGDPYVGLQIERR